MSAKRIRSANFTADEKMLLLNLVKEYKNLLENKKTDQISIKDKEKCWLEITSKFNARFSNVFRKTESLRKFYENLKKKLRKDVAEDRVQQLATGGGAYQSTTDPASDLMMSIINTKTVHGFKNSFDSDAALELEDNEFKNVEYLQEEFATNEEESIIQRNDESENENHNLLEKEEPVSWSSFRTAANLKRPLDNKLLKQKSYGCNVKKESNHDMILGEQREQVSTKTPIPIITDSSNRMSRRRPAAPTGLHSSEISKKYCELADVKLEVANLQKKVLEEELSEKRKKNELLDLEKQSLAMDIKIKETQLKNNEEEFKLKKRLLQIQIEKATIDL